MDDFITSLETIAETDVVGCYNRFDKYICDDLRDIEGVTRGDKAVVAAILALASVLQRLNYKMPGS